MRDLIDRNKALSFPFANGKYDHEHADEHFIAGCEAYKEWLETLPSAEPEQRKGKWLLGKFMPNGHEQYLPSIAYCSSCKREAYWETGFGQRLFDYCPFCGADMRVEK